MEGSGDTGEPPPSYEATINVFTVRLAQMRGYMCDVM